MEFETEAQESAYREVQAWVFQLFGESAFTNDEHPTFGLPVGVTGLKIGVLAFGEDEACVDFFGWPIGTQLGDETHRYLLELNAGYRFGDLNLQTDGTLLFEYQIPFDYLTKERLSDLVYMLARCIDEIALDLGARFLSGESVT